MGGTFITIHIAALLCGGTHGEGAAFHCNHIEAHLIHGDGLVTGRIGLWQVTTGKDMPPLIHTMRHFLRQAQFFFGEADFFSAKRLFLREARDVSGVRSNPP